MRKKYNSLFYKIKEFSLLSNAIAVSYKMDNFGKK
jgi:hypothetical protein